MSSDIRIWKNLVETTSESQAELLIQNPATIKKIDAMDPEIWTNMQVKKSLIKFILDTLQTKDWYKRESALDVYFKLLELECPWPELDVVKRYLTELSIANPTSIAEYFKKSSSIKNKKVIQQKIYEIVVEYLKKYGSNASDLIRVGDSLGGYRRSSPTKFSQDFRNIDIDFNPWIFTLYEQDLIPENKIATIEKYADLIITAYESALDQYSGFTNIYKFEGLATLENYITDPTRVKKLLRRQVGDLYNKLNSREFTNYINSIKDEKIRDQELRNLTATITRVLEQLKGL